jgi:hypothetical protein
VWWNNFNGWAVHIWHEDIGLSTLYAHVGTTTVATTTDIVSRFDPVAYVDSTGIVTGPHLHFGVVDSEELTGSRIDPFGWQTSTSTDPWSYNQGYLWTTAEPSFDLYTPVSGTISSDQTWRGTYLVTGNVTVASGVTLTLEPGTVVKFQSNFRRMEVNGTLDALGTASKPIYFTAYADDEAGGDTNNNGTSTSPTAGSWREVQVNSGGVGNFSHVVARYGGANACCFQSRANIYNAGGIINIEDSVIEYGDLYGINAATGTTTVTSSEINNQTTGITGGSVLNVYESDFHDHASYGFSNTGSSLIVASSTFSNNSSGSGVFGVNTNFMHWNNTATGTGKKRFEITGNTMTLDQVWSADNISYVILDGPVTINSGVTLTIEPGAVVKFAGVFSRLIVNGTFDAQGTASSPIYFTSSSDDAVGSEANGGGSTPSAGQWREIDIGSGASSTISHAVIRYGGSNSCCSQSRANIRNNGGTLNLFDSIIATSSIYGMRSSSGTTTVTGTEFQYNQYGFYFSSGALGSVTNNNFHDNSSYGIYNTTGSNINAEDNYWGASDGPSGSGPGSGDAVSTNIDYDPWLTTWP